MLRKTVMETFVKYCCRYCSFQNDIVLKTGVACAKNVLAWLFTEAKCAAFRAFDLPSEVLEKKITEEYLFGNRTAF